MGQAKVTRNPEVKSAFTGVPMNKLKTIALCLASTLVLNTPLISAYAEEAKKGVLVEFSEADFGEEDGGKSLFGRTSDKPKQPQGSQKIPCMIWKEGEPQAVMLAIHGFGLHKGTYDAFAREMVKSGIAVYAIDIRGFGSWVQKGANEIDFPSTMEDIGLTLREIKRIHPGVPVIVLGESMGGAIAMKTAATYPELVNGLISSVPAGDRYDKANSQMGIVKHVLLHGFNAPIDVGPAIVKAATKKTDLQNTWLKDPLTRTYVKPKELIAFRDFMNDSFEYAPRIKTTPVLFIQGSNDKLVRPAGTWKLFGSIATPDRQIVLSKTAEHLIFEDGQFNKEDLGFVSGWITKHIIPNVKTNVATSTTSSTTTKPEVKKTNRPKKALTYWIELKRDGKIFRCNNKMSFKSGDSIRFHLAPDSDGYAYLVLKQGSTGNSAILFPSASTGERNFLRRGIDYPLPYDDWLAFDRNPGLEKVRIFFSTRQVSLSQIEKSMKDQVSYVSADNDGAKDLIGTGLQLTWDDPNPVMMPDDVKAQTAVANSGKNSQVRLTFEDTGGVMAVDVALLHQ